jgi:hypothetical protein
MFIDALAGRLVTDTCIAGIDDVLATQPFVAAEDCIDADDDMAVALSMPKAIAISDANVNCLKIIVTILWTVF